MSSLHVTNISEFKKLPILAYARDTVGWFYHNYFCWTQKDSSPLSNKKRGSSGDMTSPPRYEASVWKVTCFGKDGFHAFSCMHWMHWPTKIFFTRRWGKGDAWWAIPEMKSTMSHATHQPNKRSKISWISSRSGLAQGQKKLIMPVKPRQLHGASFSVLITVRCRSYSKMGFENRHDIKWGEDLHRVSIYDSWAWLFLLDPGIRSGLQVQVVFRHSWWCKGGAVQESKCSWRVKCDGNVWNERC